MAATGRLLSAGLLFAAGSLLASAPARAQPGGAQPFTIVLDAAHGGLDTGTIFSPQMLEKNLVLDLSIHLRSALAARGMAVFTTREGDTDPDEDTRAGEANHARAAACVVLHATAGGSGVHLYTSSLAPAAKNNSGAAPDANELVPWSTAGAPFATQSLELASEIARAMTSAGIPYTLGEVRLPPLDAMRCPAVAVEVAPWRASPLHHGYTSLADADYRQRLVDALAAALVAWRGERPLGTAQ